MLKLKKISLAAGMTALLLGVVMVQESSAAVNEVKNETSIEQSGESSVCSKQIVIGNTIMVEQDDEIKNISIKQSIPEGAMGKVFNKDGKEVKYITDDNMNDLYTYDNELIDSIQDDGTIITVKQAEAEYEQYLKNIITVTDESEIDKSVDLNVKMPGDMPEGFKFVKAEILNNTQEETVLLVYQKDNEFVTIFIEAQVNGQTTVVGGHNIEQYMIQGKTAGISDECAIFVKEGNKYTIGYAGADIKRNDIIKILQSIK